MPCNRLCTCAIDEWHYDAHHEAGMCDICVALRFMSQGGMRPFASDGMDPRTDANIGNSGCESRTACRRMALNPCSPAMRGPCVRHSSSTSFWTPSSRSQFSGETIARLTGPSATGLATDAAAAARCSRWNSASSYTDGYAPVREAKMPAEADAAEAMATTSSNECKGSKAKWNRGSTHEARLGSFCCESRRS